MIKIKEIEVSIIKNIEIERNNMCPIIQYFIDRKDLYMDPDIKDEDILKQAEIFKQYYLTWLNDTTYRRRYGYKSYYNHIKKIHQDIVIISRQNKLKKIK